MTDPAREMAEKILNIVNVGLAHPTSDRADIRETIESLLREALEKAKRHKVAEGGKSERIHRRRFEAVERLAKY